MDVARSYKISSSATSIIEVSTSVWYMLMLALFRPTPSQARELKEDHVQLLSMAQSLSVLACDEIAKLDAELPNDPDAIEKLKKQRELMEISLMGSNQ